MLAKLAAAAQERVAPPAGNEAGLGRLRLLVDTYIQTVRSGDSYARAFLLLWAESVSASPALRAIFAERDQQFTNEIINDLEAGRRQGTVHLGIDSVGTAAALIAQLRGLALQMIITGDSFTPNAPATRSKQVFSEASPQGRRQSAPIIPGRSDQTRTLPPLMLEV